MRKELAYLLVLALAAGCAGSRSSGSASATTVRKPPTFALPGVPLRDDLPSEEKPEVQAEETPAPAAEAAPAPAAPTPAPAPAVQADPVPAAKPAPAVKPAGALDPEKEIAYHLKAARRYSGAKRYRSAAAEYGAAAGFMAAGDDRLVHTGERQGAMLLRAGDMAKAQPYFQSAAAKAAELNSSGRDAVNAYLGLAYCQEKAGKTAEAVASYEKALVLTDNPQVKAKVAKTLDGLKKTK